MKRSPYLIGKVFRKFLTASVLTVAAAHVASIIDASIVGNLLGDNALAAVNVCRPVLQCIFAISVLIVGGGSMLAGMAKGRGEEEKANGIYSLSAGMTVVIALAITIAGLFFSDALAGMLCSSEAVRPMASDYLRVMMLSALPMMLMTSVDSFVTLDSEPRRATAGVIVGNAVNLCLDLVFVKCFGWGMTGAALASCIMYLTAIAVALPHFRKPGSLRLTRHVALGSIGTMIKYGTPMFIGTLLLSVQFAGTNGIASKYLGDSGLVTYAVCMQLLTFSMIFINGNFRAVQPVGAVLRGMNDSRGMVILMKKAYKFLVVCLTVYVCVLCLFPGAVAKMFGVTSSENAAILRVSIPVFTIGIVLQALLNTIVPFCQLYGKTVTATLISVSQSIFPLLGFWLFSVLYAGGYKLNPWLGYAAGQLAAGLVVLLVHVLVQILDARGESIKDAASRKMANRGLSKEDLSSCTTLDFSFEAQELPAAMDEIREFISEHYAGEEDGAEKAVIRAGALLGRIISQGGAGVVDVKLVSRSGIIILSLRDDSRAYNPLEDSDESGSYRNIFDQNITTLRFS